MQVWFVTRGLVSVRAVVAQGNAGDTCHMGAEGKPRASVSPGAMPGPGPGEEAGLHQALKDEEEPSMEGGEEGGHWESRPEGGGGRNTAAAAAAGSLQGGEVEGWGWGNPRK